MFCTGGGALFAEVFLAAVAEPDAELLGDFIFLRLGELIVEKEGFVSFASAGAIVVGFPVGHGDADAAVGFFNQGIAAEIFRAEFV